MNPNEDVLAEEVEVQYNEDGLIPGQPVDFETLKKIERLRRLPPIIEQEKKEDEGEEDEVEAEAEAEVLDEVQENTKPKRKAKNETVQPTK